MATRASSAVLGNKNSFHSDENLSPDQQTKKLFKDLDLELSDSSPASSSPSFCESLQRTPTVKALSASDPSVKQDEKQDDGGESKKEKLVLKASNKKVSSEENVMILASKNADGTPMLWRMTHKERTSLYGPKDYGLESTRKLTTDDLKSKGDVGGKRHLSRGPTDPTRDSSEPSVKKSKSSDRFGGDWPAASSFEASSHPSQADHYDQSVQQLKEMQVWKRSVGEHLEQGSLNVSDVSASDLFKATSPGGWPSDQEQGLNSDESVIFVEIRKSEHKALKRCHSVKEEPVTPPNSARRCGSDSSGAEELPIVKLVSPKKEDESKSDEQSDTESPQAKKETDSVEQAIEAESGQEAESGEDREVVVEKEESQVVVEQEEDEEQSKVVVTEEKQPNRGEATLTKNLLPTIRQPIVLVERLPEEVVARYAPVVQQHLIETPARGAHRAGGGGRGRGGSGGGGRGRGRGGGERGQGRRGRARCGHAVGFGDVLCDECGQATPVGNAHHPLHLHAPANSQQRKSIRKRLGHLKELRAISNHIELADLKLEQGQNHLKLIKQIKMLRLRQRYGGGLVDEAQQMRNGGGGQAEGDYEAGNELEETVNSDGSSGSSGSSSSGQSPYVSGESSLASGETSTGDTSNSSRTDPGEGDEQEAIVAEDNTEAK